MTPRDFVYWLQGLLELSEVDLNKKNVNESLSREQVTCIKTHLGYVFTTMQMTDSKSVVQGLSSADLSGLATIAGSGAKIC